METSAMEVTNPIVKNLTLIHKIISRGLNISISKCDEYLLNRSIPQEDANGFAMYVSTLSSITHSHHLSEDEIAFPLFNNLVEVPFDRLWDDHQKIAKHLKILNKYLSDITSESIGLIRDELVEIEKVWTPHIRIEEENLTAVRLNRFLGAKEQADLTEKLSRHGMKNSGPGPIALPFLFYNLEANDREAFTSHFPWILKRALVPIIWKGRWKPMSPFLL